MLWAGNYKFLWGFLFVYWALGHIHPSAKPAFLLTPYMLMSVYIVLSAPTISKPSFSFLFVSLKTSGKHTFYSLVLFVLFSLVTSKKKYNF